MSTTPDMRAGDQDRDSTIAQLREAFAEGRLTSVEFDERLAGAQQAKTYGELAQLVDDLPPEPAAPAAPVAFSAPAPAPMAAPVPLAPEPTSAERKRRHNLRDGWAAWLGVSVLVNVIYFGSWMTGGEPGYYWPIWVMGPWGAAMLIATLSSRD